MILIADSGSTKTTWNLVDKNQNSITCNTSGINPFLIGKEEILTLLKKEFTLDIPELSVIYFYGAGATPEKKPVLQEALQNFFGIDRIDVNNDLLAAARSLCQDQPGIACILGTGSNSCFYDGKKIAQNVSPLGYILGDEGSGSVLGKKLLSDILKNQLPASIREDFFTTYNLTPAEIMENVYRKPFPNRYMAQFTRFIASHVDQPEINRLVTDSFDDFFKRNIMQYNESLKYPLHFTGSIAAVFRKNLEETAQKHGMTIAGISQAPMEGLISYHFNHDRSIQ